MSLARYGTFLQTEAEHPEALRLVGEFVSGVLGQRVEVRTALTAEERRLVFRHLSRADELFKPRRTGERLDWRVSDLGADERSQLEVPHLDQLVHEFRSRLPRRGDQIRPCWPENRPFAVCLTHDMDHVTSFVARERWRELGRMRRNSARVGMQAAALGRALRGTVADWARRRLLNCRDRYADVGVWLKLEADSGFKSSLFFFAETVHPWKPGDCNYGFGDRVVFEGCSATVATMMREIAGRGWDVGVHGSIASATEPGVLLLQKREIESIIDQPVLTTRQHYLQYDPCVTPALQAGAGLVADGTQGFNDTIGFRAGTSFPYRAWDWQGHSVLPLWEVPLHIQDGPLFRKFGEAEKCLASCTQCFNHVARVGGCVGLLFHPNHLATDFGLGVYRELLRELQLRKAFGGSLRDVATSWHAHVSKVCAAHVLYPA
mgnify:CR=1 FL=1